MSVATTDIWISAGSHSAPFYNFYTDSTGTTQLVDLTLDASKSYTFRRLNEATTHPFYLKADSNNKDEISGYSLSGDGSTTAGIKGSQSFTLNFIDPNQAPASLVMHCTAQQSMQSAWSINQAPEPAPDLVDVITGTIGIDKLKGTNSSDVIYGLGGADRINGKGGDDLIDPGLHTTGRFDRLKGGSGADTFIIKVGYWALVKDFNVVEDILDISGLSSGLDWEIRGRKTYIYGDDGIEVARLKGQVDLSVADII